MTIFDMNIHMQGQGRVHCSALQHVQLTCEERELVAGRLLRVLHWKVALEQFF